HRAHTSSPTRRSADLEYVANDKNQYLKGPEYATSIGLLMESLKIRDKKAGMPEEVIEEKTAEPEIRDEKPETNMILGAAQVAARSEEHTSELQSREHL